MSQPDAKRRALGKGLEALLPSKLSTVKAEAVEEPSRAPLEIEVGLIDPSRFQTRVHFDEQALEELSKSIAASGVVQPVVVRPSSGGRYELIAGERRWRASKMAGKATVPAVIRAVNDMQAMEMTIVENLQRADLNPMEQARAYERLGIEFNLTQEEMAKRTGKGRAVIGNFLRLLKLPKEVQDMVESGEFTFGHARSLLALESEEQILAASRKIKALSMSVRATESYIKNLLDPEQKIGKSDAIEEEEPIDPNVREAQETLQRALGLRVKIEDHNGRGKVIIKYARLEQFDALYEMLTK